MNETIGQISEHAWLVSLFRVVGGAIFLYGLYRWIMSPMGQSIRQKFSFLDDFHANKEIESKIKAGEYSQAGEALLRMGKTKKAIDVFQKGKLYSRAADLFMAKKDYGRAALLFEKAGDLKKVAEIHIQQRQFDRAQEIFAKLGAQTELAKLLVTHGEHGRAAELFFQREEFLDAAQAFIKAGMEVDAAKALEAYHRQNDQPDNTSDPAIKQKLAQIAAKAAALFEANKYYDQALPLFLAAGQGKQAALTLSKQGKYEEAGQIAREHGLLDEAAHYYKQACLPEMSNALEADHLYQAGEFHQALEKYKASGDFSKCAEIYNDLQEYSKAADMHEKAGEHRLAADIFRMEKNFARAGENYEKAGMIDDALALYREAKLETKELELLTNQNRIMDLASYFLVRRLYEQALSIVQDIPHNHPEAHKAFAIKGRVYLEKKNTIKAKEAFQEALESRIKIDKDDLDTIFFYAKTDADGAAEALEMLENKMAQNLIQEDALDHAKKIRTLIQEKSLTRLTNLSQMINLSDARLLSGAKDKNSTSVRNAIPSNTTENTKRYKRVKELGRGGMGVVYLAKDSVLDREVALKVLPTKNHSDQRTIDTFIREAKAAAALNHPNIVTVFDTGSQDGDYYIAMENIEGYTLKKILKQKGKFSIPVIRQILKQLLSALDYAHKNKIVHRDLTTSNIMWTNQKMIKIMDFGLAKVVHKLQSEQSIIGGTPSFMSPEQTLGKPVDHRTDIYSLGICIFEMCLGSLPFSKGDLGYHHLHTAPPVPREVDPSIPGPLSDAIMKCMEKKPEDRYQHVSELQSVLTQIANAS